MIRQHEHTEPASEVYDRRQHDHHDPGESESLRHHQAEPGTLVYDADGRWVGIVSLRNPHGEYLVVQRGRLFPRDLYLPTTAIAVIDHAGVGLNLSKHDLRQRSYSHPPPSDDEPASATEADPDVATAV